MIRTLTQAYTKSMKRQQRNGLQTGAQPTEVVAKLLKHAGIEK